jgi:hypothetical protein
MNRKKRENGLGDLVKPARSSAQTYGDNGVAETAKLGSWQRSRVTDARAELRVLRGLKMERKSLGTPLI